LPDGAALDPDAQSVWLAELLLGSPEAEAEAQPRLLYFSEPGMEPQRYDLNPPAGWQVHQLLPYPIGNTLWFIGNLGFLSYNPAIDQWGVFELESEYLYLRALHQSEHIVWFMTDTQLGRFDTNTGTAELIALPALPNSPPALAVTPDTLWLLLDSALYFSHTAGQDWSPVELAAPCLDQASQLAYWHGTLWMGGAHGVGQLNPAGSGWRCYASVDGMLDTEFDQIYPTDDALWFGHSWRGLWRYKDS